MRRDGGNYGSWLGWGISIADFLWTYGSEKAWMFMDEHCKDNGAVSYTQLMCIRDSSMARGFLKRPGKRQYYGG